MRIGNWITLRLCTAALSLMVSAVAATAQNQPAAQGQITAAINPAVRKVIGNSVHPLASAASDRGHADGSLAMKDMLLLLQPTQAQSAALKQYISDLHNPNSPNFHKWLTPEQYASQYGVGAADIKAVSDWLTSNGFSVDQVARGKNWIRFSGNSSQVENAFQTSIHAYSVQGQTHYANATSISIPAALAPAVAGVVRVNNFLSRAEHVAPGTMTRDKSGKFVRVNSDSAPTLSNSSKSPSPAFTSPGDQITTYLMPGDFSKIYDAQSVVASGIDGTGVSIAIVGRSDINLSDVESFRTIAGLPFNDPKIIFATTDPGDIPGDDFEASLDVEWSGAIAPKATIDYVVGASTSATDGVDVSASYIVDNTTAPIMSVSFGLCEAEMSDTQVNFYHLLWQQAAAEGISVFVSSGDAGASACNNPQYPSTVYGYGVNGLASTPYNVAVGGTEFNDPDLNTYWNLNNSAGLSSVKGYIPEAVWNESCTQNAAPSLTNCNFPPYNLYSYAGGGGASSCVTRTTDDDGTEYCAAGYPKPSWQASPGVPSDGVRDVPDVSLAAASEHVPYVLCYQGSCQWTTNSDGSIALQQASLVGGTSAASPSMASIMALVEQKSGQFQGLPNYQLYKLAAAQKSGSCDSSKRTDPTKSNECVFNDVTAGSNAVPCFQGNPGCQGDDSPVAVGVNLPPASFYPDSLMDGQLATPGYDLGSGLGSVDVANLVSAWGDLTTTGSATTLTLSRTTFAHGASITLNGVVSASSGSSAPSGEVLITATGSAPVLSIPVTAGAFTATTVNLPGGTYSLTAKYSGDTNFSPSTSAPVSVTVSPEASSLIGATFAYSRFVIFGQHRIVPLNNTGLGNSFWVQFQVTGTSGSTGATGTIKLSQAGKSLGSYPVNSSGLIYVQCGPETECDLPPGSYTIQADYSGDSSFSASSKTVPFTVNKGATYSFATANNITPVVGTQVIGSVFFNGDPALPPTGTATLTRDDTGAVLGSAKIDSTGTATIPFIAADGSYGLKVAYSGDNNYSYGGWKSYQTITTQTNGGSKKTNVSLSLGATTFSLGKRTAYSVAVTPATSGSKDIPVGFITLYSGNGQIAAQIEPVGGKASGVVEWDQVGPQSVYAVYAGDGNYAGASSAISHVTVTQAVPVLTVQPMATTVAVGAQTSISAVLTSSVSSTNVLAPTGTVQFLDSVNGQAATQIGNVVPGVTTGNGGTIVATIASVLPAGSNVITAVYSGDADWKGVTSAPSPAIVVTTPSFTDAATPNPLTLTAGETALISISTQSILGFNAPITLSCGGTLPEGVSCGSATVNPGSAGTITITTTAPGVMTTTSAANRNNSLLGASGTIAVAGLFLICIPKRRRFYHLSIALLAIGLIGGVIGCGGSGVKSSTLVLSSSNTKTASGSKVTLEATVSANKNVTGSVTFYDGSTALGNAAPVSNGVATLTTTTLPVGTHAITAKFSGDKHDSASSSSNTIQQTVTGAFTVTVNATSGSLSEPLTVPATLN